MSTAYKPLLAASLDGVDLKSLPYPLLWSPKLDGIRTLVREEDGGPVSRKLKAIPNEKVRAALSDSDFFGMDGECVFGPVTDKDVFNRTQSAVMTIAGPSFEEADGKLLVFDDFTSPDDPFADRYARLQERVARLGNRAPWLKLVPHAPVANDLELGNVERVVVEKGYEGVMLRSPGGRYKFGRSTVRELILAKVKRFADTEGVVIGFEELYRNDNEQERDALGHSKRATHAENMTPMGTLGALIVRLPEFDDATLKVGGGFTAAHRQAIWDDQAGWMGANITLKYQPSGMKDLPRFPVFKGWRKD